MSGRNVIPINRNKKHFTKAELEQRQQAEERLKPNKDKVKPPRWLDSLAIKEWKRISKELKELELLTNVDVTALAVYCDAYSKFIQANENIEQEGMFIEYTNKVGATNLIENPAVKVANKYAEIIKKFCAEFGLTPSARFKLTLPKGEKRTNPFEEEFGDL